MEVWSQISWKESKKISLNLNTSSSKKTKGIKCNDYVS